MHNHELADLFGILDEDVVLHRVEGRGRHVYGWEEEGAGKRGEI